MIDRPALLADLQKLLKLLETDLRERCDQVAAIRQALEAEYQRAKDAHRTAQTFTDWRNDAITQTAVAWVLGCVFVRFLEDNRLIEPPKLSGPGERLSRARDEHEVYFRAHPTQTDRDYLLAVFAELAKQPGTRDLFGSHNPLHEIPNGLSGDAAGELLRFLQKIDPETGYLVHDFSDAAWDTRFLGDLYQDLSEAARKKYALLQTPIFVEEFILDRTLEPAVAEFGLEGFRLIDPACGSGHFLLGAFARLFDHWLKREPSAGRRDLAQRALGSVYGVDLNPYAAAVARFRLLLAALNVCGVARLLDAPGFRIHVTCGDALLHGVPNAQQEFAFEAEEHTYHHEDAEELRRFLEPGRYHAVVANPPYITPKDRGLNQKYRERYKRVCHMQYSLAVPFMQRIFDLAAPGGYTGQITANSFMKREFGKKLIEDFFPRIDLTHVIDTSGAYIPGHGTPTVILFGRQRIPLASTIRAVMGIRGEPSTPDDAAQGVVWTAIVRQIDQAGSQSEFVSVGDSPRGNFQKHPWSIGGGGAAELKTMIDDTFEMTLEAEIESIGRTTAVGEDDCFITDPSTARRKSISQHCVAMPIGESVRDWACRDCPIVLYPYQHLGGSPLASCTDNLLAHLWSYRTLLRSRTIFGKSIAEQGKAWFEHLEHYTSKLRSPLGITYADISSHNHFVLDRGGKVFNRTAPVVKLQATATEDQHLALLGLLNSSTACFWMKQVAHQKQMTGGDGVRVESKSKVPYAFSGTQLGRLPIPATWQSGELRTRLIAITRELEHLAASQGALSALAALKEALAKQVKTQAIWDSYTKRRREIRSRMIVLQEEIDFTVYVMFGLADAVLLRDPKDLPDVALDAGERPFDILRGKNEEGFPVPQQIPDQWPKPLRNLWQRRMDAIKNSSELQLIEDPHYKRRWIGRQGLFNATKNTDELSAACESWLLDRLESYFDFDGRMNADGTPTAQLDVALTSVARLADLASRDGDFLQAAELYRGRPDFDVARLVAELVEAESVPLLPVLRYKPSGLEKRTAWEHTWKLQRREDALDARALLPKSDPQYLSEWDLRALKQKEIGDIPVPPKYISGDFQSSVHWRLRGKLDVPMERWLSFPHVASADGSPLLAWAGYDHLQRAKAISTFYVDVQERHGGRDDPRLLPLLACLIELLPWLKQWHNEIDAEFNMGMGDYFEGFVQDEARQMGRTIEDVRGWQPPSTRGRAKAKKAREG